MTTQSTIRYRFCAAGAALATALFITGCNGCQSTPATVVNNNVPADTGGVDPAAANMAPVSGASTSGSSGQPTQVMSSSSSYTPQQQSESYPEGQQAPAPIVQGDQNYQQSDAGYNQGVSDGEAIAQADQPPPPLPEYQQPPDPDPNDLWTPGYWAYGSGGYYWVPGAWVAAPYQGALWTPPYWGFYGGHYGFHHGYWGPHIGYYGGVDYGFGYIGVGYYGGYWSGNRFLYNQAVNRVGFSGGNVYNRTVIVNNIHYGAEPVNRVSYNGGRGGIIAQPRPFEVAAMHEQHVPPMQTQVAFHQQAAQNRQNFYSENHGRPAEVAVAHPIAAQPGISAPRGFEANRGGVQPAQPVNRPVQPGVENRPGQPAMTANRPEQPAAENRPGQPAMTANRPGQPATTPNRPGQPATANRPGQPVMTNNRPEQPTTVNRGGAPSGERTPVMTHGPQPMVPPATRAIQPAQPAARPAAPAVQHTAPAARPAPEVRTAPAPQQHTAPAPAQQHTAPAPHVEAAHPAPAPHVEAAHPAPAPHAEAAHPAADDHKH